MFLTELSLVSLLAASYLIVSLPWLWSPPRRPRNMRIGDESALFISDLHLDDPDDVPGDLTRMLERVRPKNLVVVGDLFHSPFKARLPAEIESFVSSFLRRVGGAGDLKKMVVTLGDSHDPSLGDADLTFEVENMEVLLTRSPLVVESQGVKVLALHGDFFCTDGMIAAAVEVALSAVGVRGAVERFLRRVFGLDPSHWIVMGHTHVPLIDEKQRVANCGSFHSHFLRSASSTSILLENGRVSLVYAQ